MLRRLLVLTLLSGLFTSGMLATAEAQEAVVVHPTQVQTFDDLRSQGAALGAAGAPMPGLSAPTQTPMPFDMVGFRSAGDVRFRTSVDGRSWSAWTTAEAASPEEGPDPGSAEAAGAASIPLTEPVWVDEARWLQVQVDEGRPEDVAAELLDSSGLSRSLPERAADAITTAWRSGGLPAAAAASDPDDFRPEIIRREEWGADESLRRGDPNYASRVRYAVVHHTAGSNDYSRNDAPSVVRGIYAYHTRSNGWSDIGYNVLVDRYGRIYEGRAGGLEYAVQGAHASGHNTGTFGISVMGEFSAQIPPPAAVYAVEDALAWKAWLNDFDPTGTVTVDGRTMPTIVGHRDVGSTACPGGAFYTLLAAMRTDVEALVEGAPEPPELPEPPVDDDGERDGDPADLAEAPRVHRDNIRWLIDQGISKGCGDGDNYCPSAPVSRAQMAAFLRRAMDLDPVDGNRFDDVEGEHTEDVNTIAEEGVTRGCSADGRLFCPDDPISRAQMATFLVRALDLEAAESAGFDDVEPGAVHAASIDALFAAGVTSGCSEDRYCPAAPVTRAEMATFLRRADAEGL